MNQSFSTSGLLLYLNRFLKYGWVTKYGTPHSYKDPIKYKITDDGVKALKQSYSF